MSIWRSTLLASLLSSAAFAQESAPLSAIDWLSESVTPVTVAPAAPRAAPIDEPPVTDDASAPPVTVTTLDGPSPDPVGLLPTHVTGLPRNLWATSDEATLVTYTKTIPPSI